MKAMIFEHSRKQAGASLASREKLGVQRRDTITVSTSTGVHSARVYRIPLSAANMSNHAMSAVSDEDAFIIIFLPGSAMRKLAVRNGEFAEVAVGRTVVSTDAASNSDTIKVSAQPVTSSPIVNTNKTIYDRIKTDILPSISGVFCTNDLARPLGKAPGDISKQVRKLIDDGIIRVKDTVYIGGHPRTCYIRV